MVEYVSDTAIETRTKRKPLLCYDASQVAIKCITKMKLQRCYQSCAFAQLNPASEG